MACLFDLAWCRMTKWIISSRKIQRPAVFRWLYGCACRLTVRLQCRWQRQQTTGRDCHSWHAFFEWRYSTHLATTKLRTDNLHRGCTRSVSRPRAKPIWVIKTLAALKRQQGVTFERLSILQRRLFSLPQVDLDRVAVATGVPCQRVSIASRTCAVAYGVLNLMIESWWSKTAILRKPCTENRAVCWVKVASDT